MPVRLTVCKPLSSLVVTLLIALNVGASFTEVTVTVKVFVTESTPPFAVPPSSRTITVMVALPKLFVTEAKVSVPVPFGLV